jgi:signal transduction histidine kinase
MNARAVRDGDEEYWEGIIEDITGQRRTEEAERRSETLRAVAELANAAAHEINNPLSVITARLELIRRHVDPAQHPRLDQALEASKRIADIIAHMGRITRMETHPDSAVSPMLDLRRSGAPPEEPPATADR